MILCLLLFCLFGGSTMTTNVTTDNGFITKSIMCYYEGKIMNSNVELVNLEPKDIPCDCEYIIYGRFAINPSSTVNVEFELLKLVTDLNKPVIIALERDKTYRDWGQILGPDGNSKDVSVLCEFATKNNVAGFLIEGLTPQCIDYPYNPNVAKYIIPYIKQLSQCKNGFIIGVSVEAHGSAIKNPCMFNFPALNDLVTFYEIQTYSLNKCKPKLYNGLTPITKAEHGANYLLGMEEVALFIQNSQMSPTKIFYDIEILPMEIESADFHSYPQVCTGKFNISGGCVQNTKNYFDKGKFVLEKESGIIVKIIDLDDVKNECGCNSAFFGFQNIVAGFRGGSQIACEKFDVQSSSLK